MKPTYRTISRNRGSRRAYFPNTDYHFQAGAQLAEAGMMQTARADHAIATSFRRWSTAAVDKVNTSDSRAEAAMFGVVIAIAVAGPLALLWITLANYWL